MGGPTSFYVWLGEGGRGGPKKNRGKDIRRALWLAFLFPPPAHAQWAESAQKMLRIFQDIQKDRCRKCSSFTVN